MKAIILEIDPSYIPVLSNEHIRTELKLLHKFKILSYRIRKTKVKELANASYPPVKRDLNTRSVTEWERTVGSLVLEKEVRTRLGNELLKDRGIMIYRKLILSNRYSTIVQTLRFTSRLMMLVLGLDNFKKFLNVYFRKNLPQLFLGDEGLRFAHYLKGKRLKVPYLNEVLDLEVGIIQSKINNTKIRLEFQYDIGNIVRSLHHFKIPTSPRKRTCVVL